MEAPSPPQMPSPPAGGGGSSDFFNPTQWTVLLALLDTVIPAVVPTSAVRDPRAQEGVDDAEFRALTRRARASMASPPDDAALQAYLAEAPSAQPAFVHGVRRTLAGVTDGARRQLGAVLLALATRPGSLVLTGHAVAVHELPVHVRAAVLRRWGASWFASLRLLAKSLAMMAKVNWLQTSGLFRQVTGYPDVPPGWTARPPAALDFVQFPPGPAGASGTSGAAGADELVSVDTDIVVVGSGCGGAVCAKVLAEAGHRVLVVDKGYYFPPSQLPMPQEQGVHYLYENGGFIQTTDQSVALVAGSCFGGGGTVNWSASLQTQGFVRREWAREHQLPLFETAEFQACLDRVCAVMGVADPVRQSDRGQRILDGAHKLGWHAAACPQNAAGSDHHCGHCHLGCGSAEKQGPVVSWLPAAARAGARFLEGFAVDRIRWDESVDEARDPLRATGVLGTWTSRDAAGSVSGPAGERVTRRVEIRAKKVIISAGTLNSPLILMRSGLTVSQASRHAPSVRPLLLRVSR